MSAKILSHYAAHVTNDIVARAQALEPERQQIEIRKAAIEMLMLSAHIAHQRMLKFQAKIGSDFQCPRCWVVDEAQSKLIPLPGNILRCRVCGSDWPIPVEQAAAAPSQAM